MCSASRTVRFAARAIRRRANRSRPRRRARPSSSPPLDRVREGVTEIEHLARARFESVVRNDHRLHLAAQLRPRSPTATETDAARAPRALSKISSPSMMPALTISARPFAQRAVGKRSQRRDVAEHADGILKTSRQVLSAAQIDAGLAADRGVDHRDERGRDVRVTDAAHVGRAANPKRSLATPPPTPITSVVRSAPASASRRARAPSSRGAYAARPARSQAPGACRLRLCDIRRDRATRRFASQERSRAPARSRTKPASCARTFSPTTIG